MSKKRILVKPKPIVRHDRWSQEQEELLQQLIVSKYEYAFQSDGGRPTVLSQDVKERFYLAYTQGLPIDLCCDYCMIDRTLFYCWSDWYKKLKKRVEPVLWKVYNADMNNENYQVNEDDAKILTLTEQEQHIIEFFDKLAMIKGQYALRILTGLNVSAMRGNVSAAGYLLRQSFREHFSDDGNGSRPENEQPANVGFNYIEINAVEAPRELQEKNVTPNKQPNTIGQTEQVESVQ